MPSMTYEIFLNVNCEQLTNRRIEIAGNTIQRGVRSEDHAVDAVCRSGGNDAVLAYSLSLSLTVHFFPSDRSSLFRRPQL